MNIVEREGLHPSKRAWFFGLMLATVFMLCPGATHAQKPSGEKVSVGILPFDDASGAGISDANVAVLARQLRAQLIQSGKLTPRMLTLTPGTALPLEPEQASELGKATKADLVVAPTVIMAESKPFQKGASTGRSVFGIQLGGAKATGATAEVKFQAELIRTSDGQRVDSFTVESKKTSTSVSTDTGGISTTLGSADITAPNFQSSLLGQALQEALNKLAGEIEVRAARALAKPSSTPPATGPATMAAGQTSFPAGYQKMSMVTWGPRPEAA